jgi:Spx/MgsR family transcriptional regulator
MPNSVRIFGIKNCDTVRKALKWLATNQIDTEFHDLKKESLEESLILEWLEEVGQDKLVNKRGTTWRNLSAEDKILDDQAKVINLIQQNPSIVKRPVYSTGVGWDVGFNDKQWSELFL